MYAAEEDVTNQAIAGGLAAAAYKLAETPLVRARGAWRGERVRI